MLESENTILKLLGMHPELRWVQPWVAWRPEDIIGPIGPNEGPSPWPMVVAELVSIASLKVAAKIAKDEDLAAHADNRLSMRLEDGDWCATRPLKFTFPPKRRPSRFEDILSGLTSVHQSLPDGELRNELGNVIKNIVKRG